MRKPVFNERFYCLEWLLTWNFEKHEKCIIWFQISVGHETVEIAHFSENYPVQFFEVLLLNQSFIITEVNVRLVKMFRNFSLPFSAVILPSRLQCVRIKFIGVLVNFNLKYAFMRVMFRGNFAKNRCRRFESLPHILQSWGRGWNIRVVIRGSFLSILDSNKIDDNVFFLFTSII